MLRNNKGFSIIELLAVVFISSVVIWPLVTTMVKNIEINYHFNARRSAASIADGTLYGLDKMNYSDLENLITPIGVEPNYYELNESTCSVGLSAADELLCDQIFASIWNNLVLNDTTYRVFIYDYNLPQATIDGLSAPANVDIPAEVRNEINTIVASNDPNPSLLRISVWIQYDDDPLGIITLDGIIFNESELISIE